MAPAWEEEEEETEANGPSPRSTKAFEHHPQVLRRNSDSSSLEEISSMGAPGLNSQRFRSPSRRTEKQLWKYTGEQIHAYLDASSGMFRLARIS